jgi:hypothetical protein
VRELVNHTWANDSPVAYVGLQVADDFGWVVGFGARPDQATLLKHLETIKTASVGLSKSRLLSIESKVGSPQRKGLDPKTKHT